MVESSREAVVARPPGHPSRAGFLNNLGTSLLSRFERIGRTEDLDEAIAPLREALVLRPPDHPYHSLSLNNLAYALCSHFKECGIVEDLEEAIRHFREALALRPEGNPDRSLSLSNLGGALSSRYKELGKAEDLEEAIKCHREALALRLPGDGERSTSLNNLGSTLSVRYEALGQLADLEEAIAQHRDALKLCEIGHPSRSMTLDTLGCALARLFDRTGKVRDLEGAIGLHRNALLLRPAGNSSRSMTLNNLASTLSTRFEQLGRMQDLEEAITYDREALLLTPPEHRSRPIILNNLAIALSTRFDQLGQLDDLEEAVTDHREALRLRPLGHPLRAASLNNLANVLQTRSKHLARLEDVHEAIALHREALEIYPSSHPGRSASLNNLGSALSARFEQLEQRGDIDEAIKLWRKALAAYPPGYLIRPTQLKNLATALGVRFRSVIPGLIDDLEEALALLREALDLYPRSGFERGAYLTQLGHTLKLRFDALHGKYDLEEVCRLYEAAVECRFSSSNTRLSAAYHWAYFAQDNAHPSTLRAYNQALLLLERSLFINPTLDLQQQFLTTTSVQLPSLALDAAAWALQMGQPQIAVEMLEKGRALLWSKMRGYRHSIDALRVVRKSLAAEFEGISADLENLAISSGQHVPLQPRTQAAVEAQWTNQRILTAKWDDLLSQIRLVDGFTDFLQAVPFSRLQSVADEGPVIITNISRYRSDAVILFDTTSNPISVSLSPSSELSVAINDLSSKISVAQAQRDAEILAKTVELTLRKLWDLIVCPILTKLETLGIAEGSRVWWCPTGRLCNLPLHAAQPFRKGAGQQLSQRYIPSYTPTLSSLIAARAEILRHSTTTTPRILVIGEYDSGLPLPRVRDEIKTIGQFGDFVDSLVGEQATPHAVLDGLRTHHWAHFACHGRLDGALPFNSSFELHDQSRLTVRDIMEARLPSAEFAFLSACHSAASSTDGIPDEVIHLAAGMQFCGFRSVVGTLWAMEDEDGPDIARDFYERMLGNKGLDTPLKGAAKAIRVSAKKLRGKKAAVDRWANFVHIGA
ncbi:TPR-like protein [Artomyces pyxidatus]|uniref:TPR-like protein n=1 Tax=Artomyces pyxidatus TaxID=48021 RepID=A0ACB8SSS2_9AGAM|nr:TPR-like protein [Artomyces pyxidatus]